MILEITANFLGEKSGTKLREVLLELLQNKTKYLVNFNSSNSSRLLFAHCRYNYNK
jgi:hypothetical protein